MKVLSCEGCNKTITAENGGLKYKGLHFCSRDCFNDYIHWDLDPLTEEDFERYGFELDEEDDEDEIVNDYDIQMGYAND